MLSKLFLNLTHLIIYVKQLMHKVIEKYKKEMSNVYRKNVKQFGNILAQTRLA